MASPLARPFVLSEGSGGDAFFGDMHGPDVAVGGELQAVDANDAVVGVGLAERPAVVDDIVVFGTGDMDDRVMAGAGCDGAILLEDLADALEGAGGIIGHRIGHGVVGPAPAAFGPHEIIFSVAGDHIGAFDIAFGCDLLVGRAVGEGKECFEVGAEAGDIAVAPTAVDHIILSVLIAEDGLVDGLGAVVELADEWFAQVIFIGALGVAGHGDADAAFGGIVLDIVCGEEEKVASVFFGDRGRPHGALSPADGVCIEDMGVFFPLDEVGGGEGVEENLFGVLVGKRRIDPII